MAKLESFAGLQGVKKKHRDVIATVTAQLDDTDMWKNHGNTAAVRELEHTNGLHCQVPSLAGWAGLVSGCKHRQQLSGFDQLHVCTGPLRCFPPFLSRGVLPLDPRTWALTSASNEKRPNAPPPLMSSHAPSIFLAGHVSSLFSAQSSIKSGS